MSEDWDFYPLHVDGEPASIYVDLGLAADAPIKSQPNVAYVRIPMRSPRPDGLSSQEEFEDLLAVEDTIAGKFTGSATTTYAGRNTSGGYRDLYFYTSDPTIFASEIGAATVTLADYKTEVRSRPDPEWEVYFGFLYPSPVSIQLIFNRRVTESLIEHGDDLTLPRLIDHFAYLPSEKAVASLCDYLREQKFTINERSVDGDTIGLSFERMDRPDSIDDVVIPIARHIQELGGNYDGWGCEVTN